MSISSGIELAIANTLADSQTTTLPTAIVTSSLGRSIADDDSSTGTAFYSDLKMLSDTSSLNSQFSASLNIAESSSSGTASGGDSNGALEESASTTVQTNDSSNGALYIHSDRLNWKLSMVIPALLVLPCLL
jgi:hypothetical protein